MTMQKTWGKAPAEIPEGFIRRIRFEPLAWTDQETPDGRTLTSAGMKDPYLPMTIKFNRDGSHMNGQGAGRIDEVTLNEDGSIRNPKRIDWQSGGAFITPPGHWHSHVNESGAPAWLLTWNRGGRAAEIDRNSADCR